MAGSDVDIPALVARMRQAEDRYESSLADRLNLERQIADIRSEALVLATKVMRISKERDRWRAKALGFPVEPHDRGCGSVDISVRMDDACRTLDSDTVAVVHEGIREIARLRAEIDAMKAERDRLCEMIAGVRPIFDDCQQREAN